MILLLLLAGPEQTMLNPAGPQAGRLNALWWFLFAVCLAVFLAVIGFLLYTLWQWLRSPAGAGFQPDARQAWQENPGAARKMTRVVTAAVIGTVIILFAFLIVSVSTGKALSTFSSSQGLVVEVTGHQWWWEVRYPNPDPSRIVTTANEIHIPVGRPVMIRGTSTDVIHSFWVPNLNGKRDLIPSRVTTLWIQADRPGTYRGQCAEFCGLQHAHMGLLVIAESPDKFEAWVNNQVQPSVPPTDPVAMHGQHIFLSAPCVLCHSIRGTDAGGQVAPDLTHLASRSTIAAATLPNTPGHLGGWIADSQTIKPGNRMPPIPLKAEDVQPLLAYLETLR